MTASNLAARGSVRPNEPLAHSIDRLGSGSRNAVHHAQLLLSVSDAMRTLSVGRTKFYELVGAGEIELVKIGSKSCAVVASIEAYVDRLRTRSAEKGA
jgi:hypothetical protein